MTPAQNKSGFFGGITKQEYESVEKRYRMEQSTDQPPIFGRRLRYFTPDPTQTQIISLSIYALVILAINYLNMRRR